MPLRDRRTIFGTKKQRYGADAAFSEAKKRRAGLFIRENPSARGPSPSEPANGASSTPPAPAKWRKRRRPSPRQHRRRSQIWLRCAVARFAQRAVECWNLFQPWAAGLVTHRAVATALCFRAALSATSRLSDGGNKFPQSTALCAPHFYPQNLLPPVTPPCSAHCSRSLRWRWRGG